MEKLNTALVTGASGGIGEALAHIHAAKGGNLVMVACSQGKLEVLKAELEAEHGIDVNVVAADLAHPDSAQRIFDRTEELGIRVDTLINNAGFGEHGLFHEPALAADQPNAMKLNHEARQ
jgi:short-subunit dehydrogenase